MKTIYDIIISPVMTEAAYDRFENKTYTFKVRPDATKPEIADAVEKLFKVEVESVNTINEKGKLKARYTKAGYLVGRTNAVKKAIVTLKEGDKIDFYSNI